MAAVAASERTFRASRTRVFVATSLIFVLYFEVFVSRYTGLPVRTLLDAVVLLVAGLITFDAFLRQHLRILHVVFLVNIVLFTSLSLLGELKPDLMSSIISSIIFSKFVVVFFLANKFTLEDLKPAMSMLAVVHVAGCMANLAFPSFFSALLPTVSYEIDTSRLMGFSLNANRSAAVSTILLLYFTFVDRRMIWALIMFALIVLSGSRSLTVTAALMWAYLFLHSGISLPKRAIAIGASFSIATILLWSYFSIDETFEVIKNTVYGDLRYIRAAMLNGGYYLANMHFPLGVGGGLYGTSMSEGSQAYIMVGIAHWASVIDMTGIYDSGIGSILGEYGWLGLGIYTAIVFIILKTAHHSDVPFRAALFLLVLVLLMNTVRTVASDFFFSFFFLYCYLLVVAQHRKIRQSRTQDYNVRRATSGIQ